MGGLDMVACGFVMAFIVLLVTLLARAVKEAKEKNAQLFWREQEIGELTHKLKMEKQTRISAERAGALATERVHCQEHSLKWLQTIINERSQPLNTMRDLIFAQNVQLGWWRNLKTDEDIVALIQSGEYTSHVLEKVMLICTELAEAVEGYRKGLMDDHLPTYKMVDVELADAVIRILDLCGAMGIDIDTVVREKVAYNATRADHKLENRVKEGGKKA